MKEEKADMSAAPVIQDVIAFIHHNYNDSDAAYLLNVLKKKKGMPFEMKTRRTGSPPLLILVLQAEHQKHSTDFRCVFINKAVKDLLGNIKGKSLLENNPAVIENESYERLLQVEKTGKSVQFEALFNKDVLPKWYHADMLKVEDYIIVAAMDITAKKNKDLLFQENEMLLQAALDSSSAMIQAFKAIRNENNELVDLQYVLLNSMAKKTIREDLTGQSLKEMLHKTPMLSFDTMQQVFNGDRPMRYTVRCEYEGRENWFDTTIVKMDEGLVVTSLDISQHKLDEILIKEKEEEVILGQQEVQDGRLSLERKDNFIRIASHELKTPVTSMMGYIDLLMDAYKDEKNDFLHDSLQVLNRQIHKMAKLINDLLDITRMDTDTMQLNSESFDIVSLVKETISFMQPAVYHQLVIGGSEELRVRADKQRINQVFMNILSNAIKYSPHASEVVIKIDIKDGQAIVSVQDFGIGIPIGHQKKIFERFYRATSPKGENITGFGIGLYIAAAIIKRTGGKIWFESGENAGSVFYFTIPLANETRKA